MSSESLVFPSFSNYSLALKAVMKASLASKGSAFGSRSYAAATSWTYRIRVFENPATLGDPISNPLINISIA